MDIRFIDDDTVERRRHFFAEKQGAQISVTCVVMRHTGFSPVSFGAEVIDGFISVYRAHMQHDVALNIPLFTLSSLFSDIPPSRLGRIGVQIVWSALHLLSIHTSLETPLRYPWSWRPVRY